VTDIIFAELHARAGIPSIDEALAERSALVKEWASHAAMYDNYGLWDSERKRRLAAAALQVRAAKDSLGMKYTQGLVEDEAHVWPAYTKFLDESVKGKAEWLIAKDRIDAITQRIQRANVLARFAASEPR
jgi:hypothetical protein